MIHLYQTAVNLRTRADVNIPDEAPWQVDDIHAPLKESMTPQQAIDDFRQSRRGNTPGKMLARRICKRNDLPAVPDAPRVSRDRAVVSRVGDGLMNGVAKQLRQVARSDRNALIFEVGSSAGSGNDLGVGPVAFGESAAAENEVLAVLANDCGSCVVHLRRIFLGGLGRMEERLTQIPPQLLRSDVLVPLGIGLERHRQRARRREGMHQRCPGALRGCRRQWGVRGMRGRGGRGRYRSRVW